MKLILLILLFSFNSQADSIVLGDLVDATGEGVLSRGEYRGGLTLKKSIIEKDVCAIRLAFTEKDTQSVEFDSLGEVELFPSDFNLTAGELRKTKINGDLIYHKFFRPGSENIWKEVFNKTVCDNADDITHAGIDLVHTPNKGVAITWHGKCHKNREVVHRYYQFKCMKD